MREMTDSGLVWVGEVPTHWQMHPVYHYFGERKHKNLQGQEDMFIPIA